MVHSHLLGALRWCLAIGAIYWGSIVIHELGHLLLGRLAGVRIAAVGIGWHQPIAWFRIRGVVLYVGRPFRMGLAHAAADQPPLSKAQHALFALGGVCGELLLGVIGLAAWAWAGAGGWGLALAGWSLWGVVASLIPSRFPLGQRVTIRNDGGDLWHLFRPAPVQTLDPRMIPWHEGLRDLYVAIGRPAEAIANCLLVAATRLHVWDAAGARSALEHPVMSDPRRGTQGHEYEVLLRVSLEVTEDPASADTAVTSAAAQLGLDPAQDPWLALLALEGRVESGSATAGEADRVLQLVRNTGGDLTTILARMLRFRALGRDADVGEGREILARLVDPHLALTMRLALVERLAMEPDHPDLRAEFALAVEAARTLARSIGDSQAREALANEANRRLAKVAAARPAARPDESRPVEPRSSQALERARISLVCSIAGLLLVLGSTPFAVTWSNGPPWWLLSTFPPLLGILALSAAAPADPEERCMIRRTLLLASAIVLLPMFLLAWRVAVLVGL